MSRPLPAAAAIGAVIYVALLGLRALGGLEALDLAAYEAYLGTTPQPGSSDSPVVILKLTDEDRRELGHWPVSDATLAEAIERLIDADARVIGIDLARDLPVPPGSAELDAILRSDPRIIGVRTFPRGLPSDIPPPPALAGTERIGFAEMLPDPDGRVRRALLFQGDGAGYTEYAFALRLALRYLQPDGISLSNDPAVPELVRLGPMTIPRLGEDAGGYVDTDAGGYQFLIDFARAETGFEFLRLADFLPGELDSTRVQGRIVIIGATAVGAHDIFDAPVASSIEPGSGVPGVELHAHIVDQLVRFGRGESRAIRVLPDWLEAGALALPVILALAMGLALPRIWVFAAIVLVGLTLLWLGGLWAFHLGWWIPIASPALAWVGGAAVVTTWVSSRERAQRALLMQLFSSHVSPDVAEVIWARRDELLGGGRLQAQHLPATVLFLDIKGFTARAEKMEPERLMAWVNKFMGVMAGVVNDHHGVVDDYFGDGLMANFGVPFPRESEQEVKEDARCAASCALAMRDALIGLNAEQGSQSVSRVAMRVGLHSGTVVAGSLGAETKLKYTTMGDVVNVTQRLESFSQVPHDFEAEPVRILLSGATRELLSDAFAVRDLGLYTMPGREGRIEVHQLLGEAP